MGRRSAEIVDSQVYLPCAKIKPVALPKKTDSLVGKVMVIKLSEAAPQKQIV